jgi:hypothetical protein
MAMETGRTTGAANSPVNDAGAGTGNDDDSLMSALDGDIESTGPVSGSAAADAAGNATGRDDLSQPSESTNEQGSDPAVSEAPDAPEKAQKPQKRDKVQERINELTARRREAEDERDRLREELRKLKGGKDSPETAEPRKSWDPIEEDPDLATIRKKAVSARTEAETARTLRRQMRGNAEHVLGVLRSRGVNVANEDEAAEWLEDYEADRREEHASVRADMATKKAQIEERVSRQQTAWQAAAEERYPWLRDEGDSRHDLMRDGLQQYPWIGRIPQGMAALAALADMAHAARSRRSGSGTAQGRGAATTAPALGASSGDARGPTVRPSPGGGGGPAARPGLAGNTAAQRRAEIEKRLDLNPDDDEAMVELLAGGLE